MHLDEVLTAQTADGRSLVAAVGHFITPSEARPIAGIAFVGSDIYRAVAASVLAATNRQVNRLALLSEAVVNRG